MCVIDRGEVCMLILVPDEYGTVYRVRYTVHCTVGHVYSINLYCKLYVGWEGGVSVP